MIGRRRSRSIDARHTPRYLAAYEWRYNRRFDLPENLARLARVAVTIKPKPYREIAAVRPRRTAGIQRRHRGNQVSFALLEL